MPPRFAYWTILIDNTPTGFRARDAHELAPTLAQLKRTNDNVELKWFAQGRLWDSPEAQRAAGRRPKYEGEKRAGDWRPGGSHKDPRARFDKEAQRKKRREERAERAASFARKDTVRRDRDKLGPPSSARASTGPPPRDGQRPWSNKPPDRRRPWTERPPQEGQRPWRQKPPRDGQRPWRDKPPGDRQGLPRSGSPGHRPNTGSTTTPRSDRPWKPKIGGGGGRRPFSHGKPPWRARPDDRRRRKRDDEPSDK